MGKIELMDNKKKLAANRSALPPGDTFSDWQKAASA